MWHLGITIKAQRQQWKITIRASAWKLEGPSGYTITIFGGGVGPTKNHACIHQLHSAILGSWKLGVYIYIHQYKRKSPEDECWSQTLFSTFFKKFHCKKLVWNTQLVLELPLLYFIEPLQSLVHAPGPPTTSTWRSPKGLAWHLRRSGRWEPNFDLVSPACFFFWSVSLDLYTYIYIHTWVWEQSNWWNYADITGCNTAPHACGDLCSHQQPQIVTAKDIDQICNGHFIQDIKGYIQSCTFNEQVCDGSVFMESYHSFTIAYIRFVSCHGEEHPSNCAFSHALSMSEGAECLRALKVAQHSQPI